MKYYKLYRIPAGQNRKHKVYINEDWSKKVLEREMWFWRQDNPTSRFIITEVTEVEVGST